MVFFAALSGSFCLKFLLKRVAKAGSSGFWVHFNDVRLWLFGGAFTAFQIVYGYLGEGRVRGFASSFGHGLFSKEFLVASAAVCFLSGTGALFAARRLGQFDKRKIDFDASSLAASVSNTLGCLLYTVAFWGSPNHAVGGVITSVSFFLTSIVVIAYSLLCCRATAFRETKLWRFFRDNKCASIHVGLVIGSRLLGLSGIIASVLFLYFQLYVYVSGSLAFDKRAIEQELPEISCTGGGVYRYHRIGGIVLLKTCSNYQPAAAEISDIVSRVSEGAARPDVLSQLALGSDIVYFRDSMIDPLEAMNLSQNFSHDVKDQLITTLTEHLFDKDLADVSVMDSVRGRSLNAVDLLERLSRSPELASAVHGFQTRSGSPVIFEKSERLVGTLIGLAWLDAYFARIGWAADFSTRKELQLKFSRILGIFIIGLNADKTSRCFRYHCYRM